MSLLLLFHGEAANYTLSADAGAVEIDGADAGLLVTRRLAASAGSITITGEDVEFTHLVPGHYGLAARAGLVSITGANASLLVSRNLDAATGSLAITGSNANLTYNSRLALAAGQLTTSFAPASLLTSRRLYIAAGAVTVTGESANFTWKHPLSASAGSVVIAGADASLRVVRQLAAAAGSITITGSDIALALQYTFSFARGEIAIAGSEGLFSLAGQAVSCETLLQASEPTTQDGCPIRTKRRHISVPKGLCGTAVWSMRQPSGMLASFSDCLSASSLSESGSVSDDEVEEAVLVRFMGCDRGPVLAEVEATIVDAALGMIQFSIPTAVCQHTGIYQFQAALVRDDSPIFIDGGIISVEHGLWGDTSNMLGPPTIEEIRFHLKDRAMENVLLRAVEFDDEEILEAIRWPVMQFNERPPRLSRRFNCNNFPFRYHWLQAVVSRLLMMAAHHYVRNKMQATGGGLTVDDKNKNEDYLRIADFYLRDWDTFITQQKSQLNAAEAWGTVSSGYY